MTAQVPGPLDSARHPFEVFVLVFGVLVGAPLLWGAPVPGSTTALLGEAWGRVWGVILFTGCLTALVGGWWTWWSWLGRWWPKMRGLRADTGLLIEYVGLIAVGVGTVIYAIGVGSQGGLGRSVPAGIVGAFGIASWWRAWDILRWVRATLRLQQQVSR